MKLWLIQLTAGRKRLKLLALAEIAKGVFYLLGLLLVGMWLKQDQPATLSVIILAIIGLLMLRRAFGKFSKARFFWQSELRVAFGN